VDDDRLEPCPPRVRRRRARPRVVIADPSPVSRSALRATLERHGFAVCGELADLPSAVDAAADRHPDVCLLDAAIAGRAFEGVDEISSAAPGTRVVILSASLSDEELLEAVAAGASGHLAKGISSRALAAALDDLFAGRSAFPRRLDPLLIAALREGGDTGH
jgi:two-component system, NarL family, nitrate/nitrite response regulator NarL